MFNTIVVGVDGREGGRDALALGARLRGIYGGELIAVHAYHDEPFVTRGASPDFETALHQKASDLVETELERTGVTARVVAMNDGSPGRVLHRAADWHDSDVIVVGSDRRGPVGRVLAGDVTVETLHGARCPVVVAPRGYAERATEPASAANALDLLVMRGRTSGKLVRHAPCPVVVVPRTALDDTQDRARSRARSLWTDGSCDEGRCPAIASSSRSASHGAR